MSQGINYLHSHSAIERNERLPKHVVLIDGEYKGLFVDCAVKMSPYRYNNKTYYKVPILTFVYKGGVFKNLDK